MEIKINNKITVQNPPQDLLVELKNRLSFTNPKWIENDRLGYWNGETPHTLKFYQINNGTLIIPRGFSAQLLSLCRNFGVKYNVVDNRRVLAEVSFSFRGKLRNYQEQATSAILARDFGTLSSPTGSGKTCMAAITGNK